MSTIQVTIQPRVRISTVLRTGATGLPGAASIYPPGSGLESSGGMYPTNYTVKNSDGDVIGRVEVTYDDSNRVTHVSCLDASNDPLPHGTYTITYDADGNFQAATPGN